MSFVKETFTDDQVLTAANMNNIEEGIDELVGLINTYSFNSRVNSKMAASGMTSVLTGPMTVGAVDKDGLETSTTSARRSGFISIAPSSNLYLRCESTAQSVYIRCFDENKTFLNKSYSLLNTATSREKTIVLPDTTYYIRISITGVGVDTDVYSLDWAVCTGDGLVTLELQEGQDSIDITKLGVGVYFCSAEMATKLTNSPITTEEFLLKVFMKNNTVRIGEIYTATAKYINWNIASTSSNWYKYMGEIVNA